MPRFTRVGKVRQFREGCGRRIVVEGTEIAVFKSGDRFYAFGDRCAHMGASLAEGEIVGGQVQCSWHGWRYDLENGRSDQKEWACVPIYEVRVEDGDVLVGLPDPSPEGGEGPGDEEGDDWFRWEPNP